MKRRKNGTNYHKYIASKAWKLRRRAAIKAADKKCQHCFRAGLALEVHHKTYSRLGGERASDLLVLCGPCHSLLHEDKYPARDDLSIEFREMVRSW